MRSSGGLGSQTRAARARAQGRSGSLYVAPSWIAVTVVGVVPSLYVAWMSLTLGGDGSQFVGLTNYTQAVFTPAFLSALLVTALFVATGLAIQLALGFGLATLLHRQLRGFQAIRTTLLIPMMLTPVVVGLMWQFMFNPDLGVASAFLESVGVRTNWFADPWSARALIVGLDTWMHAPFVMLLLLAGMAGIPRELNEAAGVDGAGWWRVTRHVTLPLLKPVVIVVVLVRVLEIARMFDVIYATTQGGPGTSTVNVSMLAFASTFQYYQFGHGAALAVALVIVMSPVYFLYGRLTRV